MPTLPHLSRDHEARECERVHRQLAFLESLRRLPSLDFPIIPLMARLTLLFFHHASIELMLGSVPSSLVFRPLTTLCCLLRRPPAFAPLSQTFEPPQDFGSSDCRFPTTHYYAAPCMVVDQNPRTQHILVHWVRTNAFVFAVFVFPVSVFHSLSPFAFLQI